MFTFTIILQLVATIAIIVFILYTIRVHKYLNEYIKNLEKVLKDHEVYLNKEIEFRDNITEIVDKCTTVLTLCNNTNCEVVSKLRNMGKDKDNKYNALITRLNTITNLINVNYNVLNDLKNEAKFSYNTYTIIFANQFEEERNIKLKTAKNSRFTKDNGVNKKNKKEQ